MALNGRHSIFHTCQVHFVRAATDDPTHSFYFLSLPPSARTRPWSSGVEGRDGRPRRRINLSRTAFTPPALKSSTATAANAEDTRSRKWSLETAYSTASGRTGVFFYQTWGENVGVASVKTSDPDHVLRSIQWEQPGMLRSIFRNDIQTTVFHSAAGVMVTHGDRSNWMENKLPGAWETPSSPPPDDPRQFSIFKREWRKWRRRRRREERRWSGQQEVGQDRS